MEYGPDFICIGAQKSGTSWLHWNLLWHPDTAMPPEKEVNFFYPVVPSALKRLLFSKFVSIDEQWSIRYEKLKNAWKVRDKNFSFGWYARYLYCVRSISQYVKLFPKPDNKITGDISPAYIGLSEHQIKKICQKLPNTKIIFLVRNPVERAWSAFKMDHAAFLDKNPSGNDIVQGIDYALWHSKYCEAIDLWEKYAPGRFRVWFYDQLCENPEQMHLEICDFLSLSSSLVYDHNKIKQKVFEGPERDMPVEVRRYLSIKLKSEVLMMHARFNNSSTASWCDALVIDDARSQAV